MGKRKISFLQKIGYLLEYAIVVPLGNVIAVLPWKIAKMFARFLGKVLFYVNTRDKKWAYVNLDIIFKDKPLSEEEKDKIIKKLYTNIAIGAVEYLKIGKITKENYSQFAEFENLEAIYKALEENKGVLVLTAHLGNWEYLASIPAKLGLKVGAIINRQFNPYTDAWLKNIREKKGKVKAFYNEISELPQMIKFLKQNGIIGIVADQTYYFKPIFVDFFGINSATADGAAKLHLKYGSPIVIAFGIMQPNGKYLLKFENPVSFKPSDDFDKDVHNIMRWINSRYEEYIVKYPDQWFSLLHPRWEKTKPEDFENTDWNPW